MARYTYLGDFKFVDTNRFWLKTNDKRKRWLHIASIQIGLREFVYFLDHVEERLYIEEITTGKLQQIPAKEENLFKELAALVEDKEYNWVFKGQALNDSFLFPHDFVRKHF